MIDNESAVMPVNVNAERANETSKVSAIDVIIIDAQCQRTNKIAG
jgi:hypothetical protein